MLTHPQLSFFVAVTALWGVLAEKVVEVVKPLREKLDAVLIFPSMPDVMRLNKVSPECLYFWLG